LECAVAGHMVLMVRHDDFNAALYRLLELARHRAEQG
jgi:hypothetical protein